MTSGLYIQVHWKCCLSIFMEVESTVLWVISGKICCLHVSHASHTPISRESVLRLRVISDIALCYSIPSTGSCNNGFGAILEESSEPESRSK